MPENAVKKPRPGDVLLKKLPRKNLSEERLSEECIEERCLVEVSLVDDDSDYDYDEV